MFEHLGSANRHIFKTDNFNFKVYLSLFLLILVTILVIGSGSRGPVVVADDQAGVQTALAVDISPATVALASPRSEIFRFMLVTDKEDVLLEKIKLNVNGLYQPDFFVGIKLFQGATQLGQAEKYDQDGNIYFTLDNYNLSVGQNHFSLILDNQDYLEQGNVLQFSFPDEYSVLLSQADHFFYPQAKYPLAGSVISFVNKGYLEAHNLLADHSLILADEAGTVGTWQLSSVGELADIRSLSISYQTKNNIDLSQIEFSLWREDELLATTRADDGQLVFAPKSIVVGLNSQDHWFLRATSLPPGECVFSLRKIEALGFASGQLLSLAESLMLSEVKALPAYLELNKQDSSVSLSDGWNEIFSMDVWPHGSDSILLNRLTWSLEQQGLVIENIELWLDGQPYRTNIKARDLLRLDFDQALALADKSSLQLLAEIKILEPSARLSVYLLPDNQELLDVVNDNFLWSEGKSMHNSFDLPHLPLSPSILTN